MDTPAAARPALALWHLLGQPQLWELGHRWGHKQQGGCQRQQPGVGAPPCESGPRIPANSEQRGRPNWRFPRLRYAHPS